MNYGRLLIVWMILLPLVAGATADMYVFAVTQDGKGIPARLIVEVTPGSGNVLITLNAIVGPDTQQSIRNAIEAAVSLRGERFDSFDYRITIDSAARELSGPSAGLPISLAVYAALGGEDIPDNVSATGTIDREGFVGKVGGIYEKLKAAKEVNITLFLIPKGERYVTVSEVREIEPGIKAPTTTVIDVVEKGKKWGIEVYEVSTLEEAVNIVFKGIKPEVGESAVERVPEVDFVPEEVNIVYSKQLIPSVERLLKELNEELGKNCIYSDKDIPEIRESVSSYYRRAVEILNKGYVYTAGNYAFLGLISISSLNEICTHPSIENPTSLAYQTYREKLEEKLNNLLEKAQKIEMTKENMDLLAGARQRIVRAETTINSPDIRSLKSVEYWLLTAEVLLEKAEELQEGPKIQSMRAIARDEIVRAEDLLSLRDIPQVRERIEWAKISFSRGWYVAAYMEAALAKAIYISQTTRENVLRNKIEYLLESVEGKGVWSEAYKNHGFYYYQAADAYKGVSRDREITMLRTALQMLEAASDIDILYKTVKSVNVEVEKKVQGDEMLYYVGIVFLILAIVFLIAALRSGERKDRRVELLRRMKRELESLNDDSVKSVINCIERKLKSLERREPSPQLKSSRPSRGKHR